MCVLLADISLDFEYNKPHGGIKKKKILTTLFTSLMAAAYLAVSAFASQINSIPANLGDTVTYEVHVSPCPDKIQALDTVIYYDSQSLEYEPYSLQLPNISGFMTNTDVAGEIRFNAIDFDGFTFDEDKILASMRFKVINASAEDIGLSYEVKTFLDSNSIDVKDTYVYDYTDVNGRTAEESALQSSLEDTDSETESIAADTDTVLDSEPQTSENTPESTDTRSDLQSFSQSTDSIERFGNTVSADSADSFETASESSQNTASESPDTTLYLKVLAAGLGIIAVIGAVFWIVVNKSSSGEHFS